MEKTIRKTRQMVIDQMLGGIEIPDMSLILEPSAGSGDLVEGIYNHNSNVIVDCIELNKEMRDKLISEGYNVVGSDFFAFDTDKKYDFVIACPTYKNNIDVEHIMCMYEHLKVGGMLISLTHPDWTTHNSARQVNFRNWLANKEYSMKMLVDNSFIENYETQPSMVIKIIKK